MGAAADEGVGMQAKRLRVSENIRTACLGLSTIISSLVNGQCYYHTRRGGWMARGVVDNMIAAVQVLENIPKQSVK